MEESERFAVALERTTKEAKNLGRIAGLVEAANLLTDGGHHDHAQMVLQRANDVLQGRVV